MRLTLAIIPILFLFVSCSHESGQQNSMLELQSLTQSPSKGDEFVNKALQSYKNELFEVAEAQLEQALLHPLNQHHDYEVLTLLGNVHRELLQFGDAQNYYAKAIEKKPNYETAWVNMGIMARKQNDFKKAEHCYNMAKQFKPNDPYLLTSLGALKVHKGHHEEAIALFKESLSLNPDLNTSYGNLAFTYAELGQITEAENWLKKAIEKKYAHSHVIRHKIDEIKGKSKISNSSSKNS